MRTSDLYIRAVGSSLVGQASNVGAAVGMLWFLNAMLAREEFAYCVHAITISRMIAMVISSGFSNVVLYRVSRLDGEAEALLSRRIAGTALSLVVLGSATVAMGVAVLAQPIASVFSKPELAPWLVLLAVLIPLNACKAVLIAWYRARQMVPTSVFFESIVPSILRVILLALAWWVGGGATEITATLATALLVSVVWLFAIEPLGPSNPLALFTDERRGVSG